MPEQKGHGDGDWIYPISHVSRLPHCHVSGIEHGAKGAANVFHVTLQGTSNF